MESIDNEDVKKTVLENTIVTGGALVSLLTGEPVHDYDVYFKTKEACANVAQYYIRKWNTSHPEKQIHLKIDDEAGKISCFIRSSGIADENEEVSSPISYNFESTEEEDEAVGIEHEQSEPQEESKDKYRPRFITSNAITLSDKIQIVTRFYGNVEEIHKNYDFAHCTCAWSSWDNEVFLPQKWKCGFKEKNAIINVMTTRVCASELSGAIKPEQGSLRQRFWLVCFWQR